MSKVAKRLAEYFVYNGEKTVFAVTEGDEYRTLSNLIHSPDIDEDTAYEEVLAALEAIDEYGLKDIEDTYFECCEPDIYTHDLLEWVSRNLCNVTWCDEAMAQRSSENFIDLLMDAQAMAKEHMWRATIDLVREMEEE